MRIGSLFSGIGGLELGLERAIPGAHTVWQVEIDHFARSILKQHWPEASRSIADVKQANSSNLEPVDLICGGFPCTDISVAGRGAGLDGAESGLWFEMLRIIDELQPSFVVIENSPGLVRRGLDAVVSGLCGIGFQVEAARIAASDLGAWHQRERLVVVAWRPPYTHSEAIRVEPERAQWEGWRTREAFSGDPQPLDNGTVDGWDAQPALARVGNGASTSLDQARWRCLGNAVVPRVAYVVGRRILQLLNEA